MPGPRQRDWVSQSNAELHNQTVTVLEGMSFSM